MTTASISPAPDALLIVAATGHGSASTVTVTGLGTTFSTVNSALDAGTYTVRTAIVQGQVSGTQSGTLTITHNGTSGTTAYYVVIEVTGHRAYNPIPQSTIMNWVTTTRQATVSLPNAPVNDSSRPLVVWTPETWDASVKPGWALLGATTGTPKVQVHWNPTRPDPTAFSSWTQADSDSHGATVLVEIASEVVTDNTASTDINVIRAGSGGSGGTTLTIPSFAPRTDTVAVVAVAGGSSSGTDVPSVAGLGLPFSLVSSQQSTGTQSGRLSVFAAKVPPTAPSPTAAAGVYSGSGTPGFDDATDLLSATYNIPSDVAVDAAGDFYIADAGNHRIRKITPGNLGSGPVVSTLAGSGSPAFVNGTGAAASFNTPLGLGVDAAGNVYVADNYNHRIRKVTPRGVVSTFAGSGTATFANGTGTSASFNSPVGIAVDTDGTVYVADTGNHRIRKITPAGTVTTPVGSGSPAFADGTGSGASFNSPRGLAIDATGTVYVADYDNNRIRKITPAGVVSTLAGSGVAGSADGQGTEATFDRPHGIAVDATGTVYVGEPISGNIRRITPAGAVTTIVAGSAGVDPTGLTVNRRVGDLYVADPSNHVITKVVADAYGSGDLTVTFPQALTWAAPYSVVQVSGSTGSVVQSVSAASNSGTAAELPTLAAPHTVDSRPLAFFSGYTSQAHSPRTGWLELAETTPSTTGWALQTQVRPDWEAQASAHYPDATQWTGVAVEIAQPAEPIIPTVSTFAGSVDSLSGFTNSTGTAARFNYPKQGTLGPDGNLYIADQGNNSIRRLTPNAVTTTFAGAAAAGFVDGTGTAARFNAPVEVACDPDGNVYIADAGNNSVRKITPAGVVSTLAGSSSGYTDGTGSGAQFSGLTGICYADDGNLYVCDNYRIRRVTLAGVVTTLAGSGSNSTVDGTGTGASFQTLGGITQGADGHLYAGQQASYRIRRVTLAGVVTTFAGSGANADSDGVGTAASFTAVRGLVADPVGNLYVGTKERLVRVTLDGAVVTAVAGATSAGYADGPTSVARFVSPGLWPCGVSTADGVTTLYLTENGAHRIRKLVMATPAQPQTTHYSGFAMGA